MTNTIQSFPLISGYTRQRWKGWITRKTWSKGLFLRQDVIKFSQDKKNERHEIGSAETFATEFAVPKSCFIDVWQSWKCSRTVLMSSLYFSKPHFTTFVDQRELSAFYIHVYLINPIWHIKVWWHLWMAQNCKFGRKWNLWIKRTATVVWLFLKLTILSWQ